MNKFRFLISRGKVILFEKYFFSPKNFFRFCPFSKKTIFLLNQTFSYLTILWPVFKGLFVDRIFRVKSLWSLGLPVSYFGLRSKFKIVIWSHPRTLLIQNCFVRTKKVGLIILSINTLQINFFRFALKRNFEIIILLPKCKSVWPKFS